MKQGHSDHGDSDSKMTMKMDTGKSPYGMFAANLIASAIVMYFVMYTMINSSAELYNNLNNVYMTLMMVTSMALFMLWMMPAMFPDRKINLILNIVFAGTFLLALFGMRTQALVGNDQFLRGACLDRPGRCLQTVLELIDRKAIDLLFEFKQHGLDSLRHFCLTLRYLLPDRHPVLDMTLIHSCERHTFSIPPGLVQLSCPLVARYFAG